MPVAGLMGPVEVSGDVFFVEASVAGGRHRVEVIDDHAGTVAVRLADQAGSAWTVRGSVVTVNTPERVGGFVNGARVYDVALPSGVSGVMRGVQQGLSVVNPVSAPVYGRHAMQVGAVDVETGVSGPAPAAQV